MYYRRYARRSASRRGDNNPEAGDIPVADTAVGAVDTAAVAAVVAGMAAGVAMVAGMVAGAAVGIAGVALVDIGVVADTGAAGAVADTAVGAAALGRLQLVARKLGKIEGRLVLVSHNYCNLPWFVLLSL